MQSANPISRRRKFRIPFFRMIALRKELKSKIGSLEKDLDLTKKVREIHFSNNKRAIQNLQATKTTVDDHNPVQHPQLMTGTEYREFQLRWLKQGRVDQAQLAEKQVQLANAIIRHEKQLERLNKSRLPRFKKAEFGV